jgi:ADP-ribose pyrophosphatase YjhB (NUDIX family)
LPDRFCPKCGGELCLRPVAGDSHDRQVCGRCSAVHYQNPRILVTGMVTCGARLLLCRRAQEPALGLWTPPAGFMELGETLEQAAARETREESGVSIDPEQLVLYSVTNLPDISEVYVSFRATLAEEHCAAGPECLEARFFSEAAIPWASLAYPEMAGYLRTFFRELGAGESWIHLSRADQSRRTRRGYRVIAVEESARSY